MRKYLAELIGTFVLVFGGVGTAVLAGDAVGWMGVSVAFGLSLLAMAYALVARRMHVARGSSDRRRQPEEVGDAP
jgi:glycerol uptake facilitator-like aquaporin